jgi:hypothetical protein
VQHNTRRTVAFIVAPLAVPLSTFFYLLTTNLAPFWVRASTIISAIIAYGGVLVFGIPVYRFLRARSWTFVWITPVVGFAAGVLMWLVFAALFSLLLGKGLPGVQFALTDRRMLTGAIWPGGVLGAAVGVIRG